jgi:hypothetical protein
MMNEEGYTYYLWHIHSFRGADKSPTVQMNVTHGESSSLRQPSAEFIAKLLEDAGAVAAAKSWECLSYRSAYQGEMDTSQWKDQWPVNWRLRVKTSTRPKLTKQRFEFVGTMAHSIESSVGEDPKDSGPINCLIIADFHSKSVAEVARQHIAEIAPEMDAHLFAVGKRFTQLQCDLGMFEPLAFEHGHPTIQAALAACEEAGGIASFNERVEEWGEIISG